MRNSDCNKEFRRLPPARKRFVVPCRGDDPVSGFPNGDLSRREILQRIGSVIAAAAAGIGVVRTGGATPASGIHLPDLRFGEGELVIDAFALGSFGGRLVFGGTPEMTLTGSSSFGNPFAVRFQGVGSSPGIEDWVYDYVGYHVPVWPNGVDQRPAIVGSVVRTAPHDGSPAGVVVSWIAVKRDGP